MSGADKKANKFGFGPLDPVAPAPRKRDPGPMGTAVRETANALAEDTEAKLEQRKKNVADAKSFRDARENGLILERISVHDIHTDALPRDRMDLEAVAQSDEMEELRRSIQLRGQKEAIEVFVGEDGRYQLKSGWRRLMALRQLHEESPDLEEFGEVTARVVETFEGQMTRYTDMVEENVIRENLTFAEMAQVAILASEDADVFETDPEVICARLYASFHKMKRSYVRAFVYLLVTLGDTLKWPKAVSRNLGVDVSRALRSGELSDKILRAQLINAMSPEAQNAILAEALEVRLTRQAEKAKDQKPARASEPAAEKEKREFRIGDVKITARAGECRILAPRDFASLDRDALERAVGAFNAALDGVS